MVKSIRAAEMDYDHAQSESLRMAVVALRDQRLTAGDMEAAVVLSHVVSWMFNANVIMFIDMEAEDGKVANAKAGKAEGEEGEGPAS